MVGDILGNNDEDTIDGSEERLVIAVGVDDAVIEMKHNR